MIYKFDISQPRIVEAANHLYLKVPHRHPSRNLKVHDFLYMVDGEWDVGTKEDTYKLKNDDLVILPANLPHTGITHCTANTHIMYFHIYSCENDMPYHQEVITEQDIVLNNFISTARNPNIKHLFQRIIQTKNNPAVSGAYVTALLYELHEFSLSSIKPSLAQAIRDYVTLSEGILTNDQIAAHFQISKRSMETLFKKTYHTTIHEYILRYRLEEAKQYLLAYPNMKLAALAQILGFCDEYHLSRSFKKHFHLSPREFKNKGSL